MLTTTKARRRQQSGLSIVELMVGIAIGLIVVAGATVVVSTQLAENRRLLLETQLQQDLRATADIVTRELRRAGALPEVSTSPYAAVAALVPQTIWPDGPLITGGSSRPNCFARDFQLPSSGAAVLFDYASSEGTYQPGPLGFRLVNGTLETRLPAPGGTVCPNLSVPTTGWQPLTDPNVMVVNTFTITMSTPPTAATIRIPCPTLCPGTNDTSCWPKYSVRELLVNIEAEARRDPAVKRAITTRVRVRADLVEFNNPTANRVCPA
jgi:type II secretory pathway component PulJ